MKNLTNTTDKPRRRRFIVCIADLSARIASLADKSAVRSINRVPTGAISIQRQNAVDCAAGGV